MFLHIGADKEILAKNIVSIISITYAAQSEITKEFIKMAEDDGFVKRISDDEAKSVVVVDEHGQYYLYFSPINSVTLQNRLYANDQINLLSNKHMM